MKWDRATIIIFFLLAMLLVMTIVREFLLVNVNTDGPEYEDIMNKSSELDEENTNLKAKLYTLESYQRIASEAAKMGLTEDANKHLYYLK